MVWPANPKSPHEIPVTGRGMNELRRTPPEVIHALLYHIACNGDKYDAVTHGDTTAEEALGDIVVSAMNLAAAMRERAIEGLVIK